MTSHLTDADRAQHEHLRRQFSEMRAARAAWRHGMAGAIPPTILALNATDTLLGIAFEEACLPSAMRPSVWGTVFLVWGADAQGECLVIEARLSGGYAYAIFDADARYPATAHWARGTYDLVADAMRLLLLDYRDHGAARVRQGIGLGTRRPVG